MTEEKKGKKKPVGGMYPYAERFGVLDALPEKGRSREDILSELKEVAGEEDNFWQSG